MTNEELNRLVAEGLGYILTTPYNSVADPKKNLKTVEYDWLPSTNLEQAINHIVPVFEAMGWIVNISPATKLNDGWMAHVEVWEVESEQRMRSIVEDAWTKHGTTTSECMAWALCKVFLKVIKEK